MCWKNNILCIFINIFFKFLRPFSYCILYFLIYRDAISLDEQEQANIASGYRLIVDKSFGENNITNKDGEALKLINKMLFLQNQLHILPHTFPEVFLQMLFSLENPLYL